MLTNPITWIGEFITRPFKSPIGWIMIVLMILYIWARVTGRLNSPIKSFRERRGRGGSGGGKQADYTIK